MPAPVQVLAPQNFAPAARRVFKTKHLFLETLATTKKAKTKKIAALRSCTKSHSLIAISALPL
jgi:hypothetical protein